MKNKYPVAFASDDTVDTMWLLIDGTWTHLSLESGTTEEPVDEDNLIDVSDDDTPIGTKEYIKKEI